MINSRNYLTGFGNQFESEAIEGALIKGRNSPQKVPYGLYAEQLSGTPFTSLRHKNLRSWLYRIRPSVLHGEFTRFDHPSLVGVFNHQFTPPNPLYWNPRPYPNTPCDFLQGLFTIAGNGSSEAHHGAAIHLFVANRSMTDDYFYNADGELLIVPQEGIIQFNTEFGTIDSKPGEIVVIPRGIKFQVKLLSSCVRGYVCENYGLPLRLPELGLIGANGLANPRDFLAPTAAYENKEGNFSLYCKFNGHLYRADIDHSPLDVVAWHGNYVPYKYDLALFNTINTVSFDHVDPSIFTVLTSASHHAGIANLDFVIFPPRWQVANETFRPPYYHRNIMSECMGLIYGHYDAKETSYVPGCVSIHNCMTAHGPDANCYHQATQSELKPEYHDHSLAFMFESHHPWYLTQAAYQATFRDQQYQQCWQALQANFQGAPA